MGDDEVTTQQPACQALFKRLEYLPIAVSVLAGLIKDDLRYTIAGVAAKLPKDATELLEKAIQALPPESKTLLSAMSACAPEGFSLSLAASLIPLSETDALTSLQQLYARCLVEERDRTSRRYRLHALVREIGDGREFSPKHAEAVHQRFKRWEANWRQYEQDMADFQTALTWAISNREHLTEWSPDSLALNGFRLSYRIGHPAEASEISGRMLRIAEERDDKNWLQAWYGNYALILHDWGRLEEALSLHKKEEALCVELGNKNSLQISYGNQALILNAWGRLDEAFALHKKEEALCLELGDKDGLQGTYGNQAAILKDRGQLDEALALLKQKEALCLELGDKDGLQVTYCNQAVILRDWGRLDEALALLKKQKTLCLKLGNKSSLGYCYGHWGLLARKQKDTKTEIEKLTAALAIFTELNMPQERDAVAAELENRAPLCKLVSSTPD